jgi:hypothetical protein
MDRRGTAGQERAPIDAGITQHWSDPSPGLLEAAAPAQDAYRSTSARASNDADQDRGTGYDLEFVSSGARGLRVGAQGFDFSLVLMSPADKVYQALKAGEQFQHLWAS